MHHSSKYLQDWLKNIPMTANLFFFNLCFQLMQAAPRADAVSIMLLWRWPSCWPELACWVPVHQAALLFDTATLLAGTAAPEEAPRTHTACQYKIMFASSLFYCLSGFLFWDRSSGLPGAMLAQGLMHWEYWDLQS